MVVERVEVPRLSDRDEVPRSLVALLNVVGRAVGDGVQRQPQ